MRTRAAAAVAALGVLAAALAGCAPDAPGSAAGAAIGACGPQARAVDPSADALQRALDDARPGDVLALAAATYRGPFTITTSGADEPITLCGTSASVLDGGSVDSGYALHLDHVADWVLTGFRVTGGQKGIVLDGVATTTLTGLEVSGTGQEAVHLRAGSSDNVIDGLVIHDTGRSTPEFGEGVYIGTAASNWCTVTACEPDRSDRNRVTGTTVFDVTAEAIDVKEGTSDGVISGNTLSIADAAAVDSVVDLKGTGWLVADNRLTVAAGDGIQIHSISTPVEVRSGASNTVSRNTFDLSASAVAVTVVGAARRAGNTVTCDNVSDGASTPPPMSPSCR
ncbi:right-handed parallel beta-helix repeat-containing protein [Microbacterium hominis]|uniref:right-handed parallel beta-helix repeat-containing protein n=1 Tax=Microbacterium hominis TaxID=162426 RepID=UPI000A8DD38A|nr:right-handed parallel beta-helix repeat-containing protein [Microbacterium hominis]